MKTISVHIFACIFLAASLQAVSQTKFVVLSLKGKVEWAKGKSSKWQPAAVGQELAQTDRVRTSYGSYVKLMMNKERIVSVDENRTRALSEFASGKSQGKSGSATGQIMGYVSEQVKMSKEKKSGNVFGAVRGYGSPFCAVFPRMNTTTSTPVFTWVDADKGGRYQIVILDDGFRQVLSRSVTGESFAADAAVGLKPGRTYYWQLIRATDNEASEVQQFKTLPADTVTVVREELKKLDAELASMNADEATTHLTRAVYYERRGLVADAYNEYCTVLQLAPGVEEYRDMLRNLLITVKLYNEIDYLVH